MGVLLYLKKFQFVSCDTHSIELVCSQASCAALSRCFTDCTGKYILCLRVFDSCSQLQSSHVNYEFNRGLHDLSLMQGMISRGLLGWKLEMRTGVGNGLCLMPFLQDPIFLPAACYSWVGTNGRTASCSVVSLGVL